MKKIIIFLSAIMLVLSLTGCAHLESENTIKKNMKELFNDVKIVQVDKTQNEDGLDEITYNMTANGINFHVWNSIYYATFLGNKTQLTESSVSTDYMQQVMEHVEQEIQELSKIYNIDVQTSKDSFSELGYNIKLNIDKYDDIEQLNQILNDIKNILEKFLPKSKNKFWETPKCTISVLSPALIASKNVTEHRKFYAKTVDGTCCDMYDFTDVEIQEMQYYLAINIKEGILNGQNINNDYWTFINNGVPENTLDTVAYYHSYVEVYIDGVKFESEKYGNPKYTLNCLDAVYSPSDNTYYLPVAFGTKAPDNGAVDDFAQREMINKIYPNSNYTVSKGRTEYAINENSYEITVRRNYDLVFKKNGITLDIEDYDSLNNGQFKSNATWKRYISAKDYAELIGCTLDRIDYMAGGVYFKTK